MALLPVLYILYSVLRYRVHPASTRVFNNYAPADLTVYGQRITFPQSSYERPQSSSHD